jgi:putative ABC transport system ATP-binding protein
MDLIKEMARTNHQTIVMVTHDRRLAEYADRIIHIFDGKVEEIEVLHENSASNELKADEGKEKSVLPEITEESIPVSLKEQPVTG